MMFKPFPYNAEKESSDSSNPAIQLFGNRFYNDQTVTELLAEFLLVVNAKKKISENQISESLPSYEQLLDWPDVPLNYSPQTRINLKLFSFLGASRIDSRHEIHRQHHKELINLMLEKITLAGSGNKHDVIRTLENLFLGFQGAGSGRTWCAQSFFPLAPGLLAGESIWKETSAKKKNITDWDEVYSFFSLGQHVFYARGGELLYLQICNALRQSTETIQSWAKEMGLHFSKEEGNPKQLHAALQKALSELMKQCPQPVSDIADFIDTGLDAETTLNMDYQGGQSDSPRFVKAGWCPDNTWQEGYLFAVELLRLCRANLDVIERFYLLETACSMQVLRSLVIQSARSYQWENESVWPGYRIAVSAPEDTRSSVKRISKLSVKAIEKLIFKAIRYGNDSTTVVDEKSTVNWKNIDKDYAGKLFLGLGKRIGFIVPRRGAGARFVLTEQILRYLVITTVPADRRLTVETFKALVERHHGLVFDSEGLNRASQWVDGSTLYLPNDTDAWLHNMLDAAGLLVRLSDSCALVVNPASNCH